MSIRVNIPSPPEDPNSLSTYLDDSLQDIESSLEEIADGLHEVLSVEPLKPQIGQEVYADGVNFNPGSGEGLYIRKSTGWVFIA